MNYPQPPVKPEDVSHLRELHEAMLAQSTPKIRWALYLMTLTVILALVWAFFAEVEEITEGQGKVISNTGEQIIQSLEGGILAELSVKEGAIVEKGQPLLRIDPTRANAAYQEGHHKMIALQASVSRLRAEAYDQPLVFPASVQAYPEIIRNERAAYASRKRALEQSVEGLSRSLTLIEKEIELTEPLAKKGLISDLDLIKSKRQANETRMQIAERQNKFVADANQELVRAESELSQTRENTLGREDTMRRTLIKAPVHGTVKNIRMTTIGAVIAPGSDIMEIVPLNDQLLIEAKIPPQDVAFLRPGLEATVKVTAYDYAIYGSLTGTLELISPDTLREDKQNIGRPGSNETYYKVIVRTTSASLRRGEKEFTIMPGMTTSVQIKTGKKTVMDYLLKPIFKTREAFRER